MFFAAIFFVNTSNTINAGINSSEGDYIAIHSGDDISLTDRISEGIDNIESRNLDVQFTSVTLINEKGRRIRNNIFPEPLPAHTPIFSSR